MHDNDPTGKVLNGDSMLSSSSHLSTAGTLSVPTSTSPSAPSSAASSSSVSPTPSGRSSKHASLTHAHEFLQLHEQSIDHVIQPMAMHAIALKDSDYFDAHNSSLPNQYDGTNLIINYIPATITEEMLRSLFQSFGTIERCKIVNDKFTGMSLGYGFVKFDNTESALAAVTAMNGHVLGNKRLKVSLSKPPEKDRKANLYISGLPTSWGQEEVAQMVTQFGPVIEVRILFDANSQRGKGVGFARFEAAKSAALCIATLNGVTVPGGIMPLNVRFADTTSDKIRKAMAISGGPGSPAAAAVAAAQIAQTAAATYSLTPAQAFKFAVNQQQQQQQQQQAAVVAAAAQQQVAAAQAQAQAQAQAAVNQAYATTRLNFGLSATPDLFAHHHHHHHNAAAAAMNMASALVASSATSTPQQQFAQLQQLSSSPPSAAAFNFALTSSPSLASTSSASSSNSPLTSNSPSAMSHSLTSASGHLQIPSASTPGLDYQQMEVLTQQLNSAAHLQQLQQMQLAQSMPVATMSPLSLPVSVPVAVSPFNSSLPVPVTLLNSVAAPLPPPSTVETNFSGFCMFVYHLPLEASEQTLFQLFSHYGTVTSVKVMRDLLTGRSKGFGFVNMATKQEATSAIQGLNGYALGSKFLKVSFKNQQSPVSSK